MTGCKTDDAREFSLRLCIANRYTKRELDRQIGSMPYERTMISHEKQHEYRFFQVAGPDQSAAMAADRRFEHHLAYPLTKCIRQYITTIRYIAYRYYTGMVLMPAVRKVSKEQIIDAAVDVLRDDGFSAINARSVAKKLGCSTQPIYFSFKSMDELKAALTERAIQMHTQRVRDSLRIHEGNDSRYSSYGMGFVKFAAEEKQLFRWLYLEGEQLGPYQNDVLTSEVISVITEEFGYEEDIARRFHQDMVYFTYGLAILANTDHLHLTEAELREAFRREFRALIAIYGKPAKLPEFAMKAGVVL